MIDISVVVITYNRSDALKKTVQRLREALDAISYSYELIIADDCSDTEHQLIIDSIPDVKVVRTNQNSGLGANVNNGLAHCAGRFILQLQDDWLINIEPDRFKVAISFLDNNQDVGILQLTSVGTDLPIEHREWAGDGFQVFVNDRLPWNRSCVIRPYSDQPHLKRKEFIADVGPYLEHVPMTTCENEYKKRVANQTCWQVAMIDGPSCFLHFGADISLNPGGRRHPILRILKRLPWGEAHLEPSIRLLVKRVDHCAAKIRASYT